MRLHVHTRTTIQGITRARSHAIISVRTPGEDQINFIINPLCRNILHLAFDDLDRPPSTAFQTALHVLGNNTAVVLFDSSMADMILNFWATHRDVDDFYIHCGAGYSRSPAIAAALSKIDTGDDSQWFHAKRPNMLVYRTLLDCAHTRGLI